MIYTRQLLEVKELLNNENCIILNEHIFWTLLNDSRKFYERRRIEYALNALSTARKQLLLRRKRYC